jgi:hypothetical protein
MKFNEPPGGPMEKQYPDAHPELRELLYIFDEWSHVEGLPEPVITDLFRDIPSQIRIYVAFWRKLQASLEPGPRAGQLQDPDGTWRPLTPSEQQTAKELRGLFQAELEKKAETKFTWHWVRCAADVRTYHYSRAELAKVKAWFEARCQRPRWEFLVHDVTAPHMHIGRRDFEWRTRFSVPALANLAKLPVST